MAHFVETGLLKELDDKKRYLNTEKNKIKVKRYLEDEANQHSARIELPKAFMYKEDASEEDKQIRLRDIDYYKEGLEKAWSYAIKNLKTPLDESFIKRVAYLLDKACFEEYSSEALITKEAGYRRINDAVRPSGATKTPPYAAKIPNEMKKLTIDINKGFELLDLGKLHPVELAAYSHLNHVRIHPFTDCNGRTSRMLQNSILYKNGFPPAIIYEGERRMYHQLLDDAIVGYNDRESYKEGDYWGILNENDVDKIRIEITKEKAFFDFIANKVNVSLDKLLDS